ncbi:hypothetical protein SIID45300_01821 [Candidatus Magnetaquicoccaceae bacterium FCR-1]|uniref:Membrane-fusion protein n=1 Tax=Candidatus Magnetaquiglobus chichijimensis TaxID=3141448 RepID=A0ABQ0C9D7_9PROT
MNAYHPLVTLLQLAQRIRNAPDLEMLRFILVNETHGLVPYRQAVLWNASGTVEALSGIPSVDADVPYVLWLRHLFAQLQPVVSDAPLLMEGSFAPLEVRDGWSEWWPEMALLIPLQVGETLMGWLLLARETPFEEAEVELLRHLGESHAHAWRCLRGGGRALGTILPAQRWKTWAVVGLLVIGGLAWPVPLTVLAPAEVVPRHPEVIRSPMDGVIDRFHVQPNDPVTPGQPLFDLDETTLKSRLEVAEKSLAVTESEYLVTSQLALQDSRSKAQLAIFAGRVEEKRLEADGVRDLLARGRVKATRAGIALFSDPQGWIGRPVMTGEKILTVADARDGEVEAWLPAGDVIPLEVGASVTLFLNIDPLHPRGARLRLLAYEPVARPDGIVAHQLRATLDGEGNESPRLGLKGTARIAGDTVSLGWWMARRPLALARQWLGW